jgi:hypothetical protein
MKKEQEKELNSKIPTITCACGKKLIRDDIRISQTTEIFYRVFWTEDGYPEDFEEYERDPSGNDCPFCTHCGRELNLEQINKLQINL